MIRTCLILAALGPLAGCWNGEVVNRMGDDLSKQFSEKNKELNQTFDRIGKGMSESYDRSAQGFKQWKDTLVAKYNEAHRPPKPVLFEGEAAAQAAPKEAALRPAMKAAPPAPKEIRSELLSERTLQRRGLRVLWKLPLDGSGLRYTDLNDGYLYPVTRNNAIYAIDMKTGLTRWTYDLGRRPDSPPGFNDEYVVISAGDIIRVIDKQIGREKWRFDTSIQPASRPYCTSSSFVYGCWGGNVAGFQFGEQHPRWTFEVGASVFATPDLRGSFVYAADDTGVFRKYNIALRVVAADLKLRARPVGDLVATEELIFLGNENYEMNAVRTSDVSIAWKHACDGRVIGGPWLSGDAELLFYSAQDDGLYALTAATGKERWRVPGGVKPVASSAGTIFVLRNDGTLSRVDSATGKVLWSEPIAPFVDLVAQVGSDILFLLSGDGQIYAVTTKK